MFTRIGISPIQLRSRAACKAAGRFASLRSHSSRIAPLAAFPSTGVSVIKPEYTATAMATNNSGSSVRADLETLFRAAIASAFAAFPDAKDSPAMIAACNNAANGDYQCNNAMALFAKLKGKEGAPKSPRDVAQAILAALPANGVLADTSLAGPGFINCRLTPDYLSNRINNMLEHGMTVWAPPLPVSGCGGLE